MRKIILLVLVICLGTIAISAESHDNNVFVGKWLNGKLTLEIEAGLNGYVVKYDRPPENSNPIFMSPQQSTSPIETIETIGTAYSSADVLFIQISGANWVAIITKDNQLLIGGTFFTKS